MKKPKKNVKTGTSNNKKEPTKSKQLLNKSMEKKKKVGLSTEQNKNSTIEVKSGKDKISIVKPIKKDKTANQKSSSMTNRSAKSTKSKEYDNKLNEDNDYENEKTKEYDFFSYKEKPKPKTTKPNDDDTSDDGGKEKGDFLYRTMYKTNVDNNKGTNVDNLKTPDNQKNKKDKEISKSKERPVEQPPGSQFAISVERTDDITYDIGDKKIHSNIKKNYQYNNYKTNNDKSDYKVESEDSTAQKYSDNQNKKNNYNSGSNYDRPSTRTYSSKYPNNYINERTIDLYVIDTDGEEPVVSTRNTKRIDRTRNKIKEVKIEKYDPRTPIRDEKLTGFVLIRKSKGKRIYDVEFEDDIGKINEILKNKKVMIKNEIIQFVTLTKLSNYERDIKNYADKISRLQNDINKKDYSQGRDNDDKNKEYEMQVSELKSKNQELQKKVFKLQDELDENIREFKQVKLGYDQLKDSIEREKLEKEKMEKERKEKEPVVKEEPSKIKKKAAQMQQDEDNDQKAIKEMKLRIKKYKDVLRNPDDKNKIPFTYRQDDPNKGNISPRKKHKASIEAPETKEIQLQETQPAEEEDDEIGEYVLGDEDAKDPKKRKLKNAVNRFRKKYQEVIKEEKKAQREKEREEKEREENEERELEDENYQEEKERQEREREELERQERERKEREEREERERREREEKERREREERERKERERKEKEKRDREERERKERERKEKEKRDREEKERKERERKEKEKRDREEKERKDRERKEKDKKDNKTAFGGGRMGGGKMAGNFAKMLADKLKMAPPGGMKKGSGVKRDSVSKPPVIEKNVDAIKLLEEQPFQGRKDKKKPTRKVFVIEDDDE